VSSHRAGIATGTTITTASPIAFSSRCPTPTASMRAATTSSATAASTGRAWRRPHVSALAALLISQGITDPKAVRAAIEQNAEPLGGATAGTRNDDFGHGLIHPEAALSGLGLNTGPQK